MPNRLVTNIDQQPVPMSVLSKRTRDDPRKQATVLAFLDATEALLEEGASFADLNVSRIADRAGRTRTAFYAHFEDRRELLLALFETAASEALAAIRPFQEAAGTSLEEEIARSVAGLFGAFRKHATLLRAVVEAAGYDESIAALWGHVVGRFIESTRKRLLAEKVDAKKAAAIAAVLVWMTERTCYQQAVRGSTGIDDKAAVAAMCQIWSSTLAGLGIADRPKK